MLRNKVYILTRYINIIFRPTVRLSDRPNSTVLSKGLYEATFETTCKTSCAVTSKLLTRGHYLVKKIVFVTSVELKRMSSCEF